MATTDTTPTWRSGDIERFSFFADFWESIKEAPQDKQLEIFHAIMQYCFCGIEPTFQTWELKAIWNTIKHRLYISCTRTSVGKFGGAPKGNSNAKKNRPQPFNLAEATNYPTDDAVSQQSKAGEEPVLPEASTHTIPAEATTGKDTENRPNIPADDARTTPQPTKPAEATNYPTPHTKDEQTSQEEQKELRKSFNEYWSIGKRKEEDKIPEWKDWQKKGEPYRTAMMQFVKWWEAYGKSRDKQKCIRYWLNMKPAERQKAIDVTPAYVLSTPDVQYRKDPYTWLYNHSWENEIITHHESVAQGTQQVTILSANSDMAKLMQTQGNKVAREQEKNESYQKEKVRLLGLINLVKSNPNSSCKGQLKALEETGYLSKYGLKFEL